MTEIRMIPVGEIKVMGDVSGALLVNSPGTELQAAVDARVRIGAEAAIAEHPDVIRAAEEALTSVGAVVSKGTSATYLDVSVITYLDPIEDPIEDALVVPRLLGRSNKQLRLAVLDEQNQLPASTIPEQPRDLPTPAPVVGGAITSDGLTSAGLPITVNRLMDPVDDYITDELEAGGRAPQQATLVVLGPDGTIPAALLPPTALPSGLVIASISGDPSDPDITLYANGIEL